MNNYPPGVTGNEYEISGPDYEETETVECDAEAVMLRTITDEGNNRLVELLGQLNEMADSGIMHETSLPHAVRTLRNAFNEIEYFESEACPFRGEVDVTGYRAQRWWTCPACGTLHETELSNDD